jgi:phage tail-like protein
MAQIANTRKVFQFVVEVAGLNQFEVQTVELPEIEVEAVEHGDTNHSIKTAGRITTGDMTFEKVRPLPQTDKWAWEWLNTAQDPFTGGGSLPLNHKQIIIVKEMDTTQTTTINSWYLEGCWVKKVSQSKMDRMSSDNIIETIIFSVDRCKRL